LRPSLNMKTEPSNCEITLNMHGIAAHTAFCYVPPLSCRASIAFWYQSVIMGSLLFRLKRRRTRLPNRSTEHDDGWIQRRTNRLRAGTSRSAPAEKRLPRSGLLEHRIETTLRDRLNPYWLGADRPNIRASNRSLAAYALDSTILSAAAAKTIISAPAQPSRTFRFVPGGARAPDRAKPIASGAALRMRSGASE